MAGKDDLCYPSFWKRHLYGYRYGYGWGKWCPKQHSCSRSQSPIRIRSYRFVNVGQNKSVPCDCERWMVGKKGSRQGVSVKAMSRKTGNQFSKKKGILVFLGDLKIFHMLPRLAWSTHCSWLPPSCLQKLPRLTRPYWWRSWNDAKTVVRDRARRSEAVVAFFMGHLDRKG